MMDEDERADSTGPEATKQSKRDRFKGALARTKSKFKKQDKPEDTDNALPDDVNEFLSAGRVSTSSWNSAGGTLFHNPPPVLSSSGTTLDQNSSRPSTSDSSHLPKQSPRRMVVPRIDVSNSQRWPGAQPIGPQDHQASSDFLRPEYQSRSQSASSLSKRKGRARNLSVSFIEAPPIIIGEGGDDAQNPTVEISKTKARARARSVSPMTTSRSHSQTTSTTDSPAPLTNGPLGQRPSPLGPRHEPPEILKPRAIQRVQTGLTSGSPLSVSALDREFEMTLRLGSAGTSPESAGASPHALEILAPRPVRPVQPPPAVFDSLEPHVVKKETPAGDLRRQFREGDILRMHVTDGTPDIIDDVNRGTAPSRRIGSGEQQPTRWI